MSVLSHVFADLFWLLPQTTTTTTRSYLFLPFLFHQQSKPGNNSRLRHNSCLCQLKSKPQFKLKLTPKLKLKLETKLWPKPNFKHKPKLRPKLKS
jgi:hypothetical protein